MKRQSPGSAEAGEIRSKGINTGSPWGSSAAATEAAASREMVPVPGSPVPVVCDKISLLSFPIRGKDEQDMSSWAQ